MEIKDTQFCIMGKKTTVCLLVLENGFEIVGSASCVNPEDFNVGLGQQYARQAALRKYEEFKGFARQLNS